MDGEGCFARLRRVAVVCFALGAAAFLTGCAGSARIGGKPVDWKPHFASVKRGAILISLDDRRLAWWGPGGKEYREFKIAVPSQDYLARRGRTRVVRRRKNPDWRPTPAMLKRMPGLPSYVGPGPQNPLGERALYLGWKYYAIHGTNNPRSIGTRATSGCFRLYPRDIAWLFDRVQVGTPVKVVDKVRAFGGARVASAPMETDKEFAYHAKRAARVADAGEADRSVITVGGEAAPVAIAAATLENAQQAAFEIAEAPVE